MKVLVVDDDAAIRFVLAGMLEDLGHEVVASVSNESSALEAYVEKRPDLVTLDLNLSGAADGSGGLAVLRGLRKLNANVNVIVVSGSSQARARTLLRQAGAVGFVDKPIRTEALVQAISKVTHA
ncbi:MAG: response regulator [Elusimicrobiota bacterium]